MRSAIRLLGVALLGLTLTALTLPAADSTAGITQGPVELKSAGPLAFGPDGVLFVGDPMATTIYAVETGDKNGAPAPVKLAKLDERIAHLLGTTAAEVNIADITLNPASGTIYFSVARGRGPEAAGMILRLNKQGELTELPLKDVKFSKAVLPNPKTQGLRERTDVLTGLAYADGKVFVAGLSNEEFASKLRVISYPFKAVDRGASIEIFHANHNKLETNSPVRTFTPYQIAGEAHLLAAYTCTPLVRIPVSALKPGEKVKGVTVAELGNRNKPLDMVVYNKGGKDYLLMSNSARGVMKIPLDKIGTADGLTVRAEGTAGIPFETIESLKGVVQLTKLDNEHALILTQTGGRGPVSLETIDLP